MKHARNIVIMTRTAICSIFSSRFDSLKKVLIRRLHLQMDPISQIICLQENELPEQVKIAQQSLANGNIIAVPTDTIYGLAGLTQNSDAIKKMYNIKQRDASKPISISVGNIPEVYRWAYVTICREMLHDLLPGPVTLVFERKKELNVDLNPGAPLVGIRIPDHQFVRDLASACNGPLALTSANVSCTRSTLNIHEFQNLWPQLDLVFDGGQLSDSPMSRLGSTVIDLSKKGTYRIIRQGCAYKDTCDILNNKYNLVEDKT